jgi:hypothetical protein
MSSTLRHSAKRSKSAGRIRILFMLYWLGWLWVDLEPDLSEIRKRYVERIDQILKEKGRKV